MSKCLSCDMPPPVLSEDERIRLLSNIHPGWNIREGKYLVRKFPSYHGVREPGCSTIRKNRTLSCNAGGTCQMHDPDMDANTE